MTTPIPVESLFFAALALPPEKRVAYLDIACGEDAELRRQVDKLLAAQPQVGAFLEQPAAVLPTVDAPPTLDQRPPDAPGVVLAGKYKLLEEIGEGGMGTVWSAQQSDPVRRLVAVKLIKPGMDSKLVLGRFEAERQALALMDHPNIAKVHDAGTTDEAGRPFFVMELVRGVPITKYCDEHHLTPRQRLELFVPVCHAVQHAHQKGIIHRDIKPSNVLVALYDDRPVPKVIDFGVAKATGQQLTEETLHTGFGAVVGTVEYMSPEQASFNQLDVDTRSDIYSLGVLLYELLAGSPPFTKKELERSGMMEMLRVIREQEPSTPSKKLSTADGLPTLAANRGTEPARLTKLVRGELDWIVMKALEKDRSRRYETANGFASDILHYLADETVQACPPSVAYRVRKFARKNRVALLTSGLIASLLVAGTAVSIWLAVRARIAERDASDGRDQAVTSASVASQKTREAIDAREQLRDILYAAEMNLVGAAWEADNVPRVRELLRAQIPPDGQRDLRGFEWHYWDRLSTSELHSVRLPAPAPPATRPQADYAQLTADGTRMVSPAPAGDGYELQMWDATTGTKTLAFPLMGKSKQLSALAISPDGARVVTITTDRGVTGTPFQLRVHDAGRGAELAAVTVPPAGPSQMAYVSVSADASRVLTCAFTIGASGEPPPVARITVWDPAAKKELFTTSPVGLRREPVLSPDGTRVAAIIIPDGKGTLGGSQLLKVWDVTTGKEAQAIPVGGDSFQELVFSPDGKRLAASAMTLGSGGVRFWDTGSWKELRPISGRRAGQVITFSPDSRQITTFDPKSPTVAVWDVATGQTIAVLKGHETGVRAVAFGAGGTVLRALSLDGTIRTWELPAVRRNPDRGFQLGAVRFSHTVISSDGERVAEQIRNGPDAGRFELQDGAGKRLRLFGPSKDAGPGQLAFSALNRDGTRLAGLWIDGNGNSVVRVWDTRDGNQVMDLKAHGRNLPALSDDGEWVTTPVGGTDKGVGGWEWTSAIKVVNLADGKEVRTVALDLPGEICSTAFSPDRRHLVTVAQRLKPGGPLGGELSAQLWDLTDGRELARLASGPAANGLQSAVAFSRDGSLVAVGHSLRASAGGQGVVDVWETSTLRKRHELRGHNSLISAVCFSPDGRRLVSASITAENTESDIKVWDVVTGKELAQWNCLGGVSGLAFRRGGLQLVGVRTIWPETEEPMRVWDGRPRDAGRSP